MAWGFLSFPLTFDMPWLPNSNRWFQSFVNCGSLETVLAV
jgi:hypothetical protein